MIEIHHSLALDDSCQIQFYAVGHHEEIAFREAVARDVAADHRAITPEALALAPMQRTWWRRVPLRNNIVGDSQFVESGPGRGAFSVTLLNEWFPLHAYLPRERVNP